MAAPEQHGGSRRAKSSIAAAVALPLAVALASCNLSGTTPEPGAIRLEASSDQLIWNAVVADGPHLLVSGPRWAGASGPQLASITNGEISAFPDAAWNSWKPGEPAGSKFVNLNALHRAPDGALWAVDTGSPSFGGDPLPDGAKVVRIDLATGRVTRIIHFPADIARPGSYVDDIRFHGSQAYLTDAGNPGIIVLDLASGKSRRVLDHDPSTVASGDRPIVVDGAILRAPGGASLKVHSDPLELSPDGKWLFYGPLSGPWWRVPTEALDNPTLAPERLARLVEPFADLPPTGGTTMDAAGNLYFSDLATDAIRVRRKDGTIDTIARDPRLHWVDAMYIDDRGRLWMPAAQIDRVALFQKGKTRVKRPIELLSIALPKGTHR